MALIKIILIAVAMISIIVFTLLVYLVLGRKKGRIPQVEKVMQQVENPRI